jgi:hypothetical protein
MKIVIVCATLTLLVGCVSTLERPRHRVAIAAGSVVVSCEASKEAQGSAVVRHGRTEVACYTGK